MNKKRKLLVLVATLLVIVSVLSSIFTTTLSASSSKYYGSSAFNRIENNSIYFDKSQYFDSNVVYSLPEGIAMTEEISLIIELPGKTLLDCYNASGTSSDFSYYYASEDAKSTIEQIQDDINAMIATLDGAGVEYTLGLEYSTLLRGFEITTLASEYEKVCDTVGTNGMVHIGDIYERADSKVVTNDVNVYETGIFDGSVSKYNGTGVVVAVLDTGLDYTHTAFAVCPDPANHSSHKDQNHFDSEGMRFDISYIESILTSKDTEAEKMYKGLTAADLYINDKVPFAFDYADSDPEVFPQRSNHGTHVAGIIAGNNDVITGVAPNAQLAIMKVFSDKVDGAKSSWILAALEDCVNLGVDVINMSLGSSCGFSNPSDTWEQEIYAEIEAQGLSLIVAAGNDNNSAVGSTKNGNLPLTSNPDSATVGSPGSYKASLTVASISGVPQAYLLYGDKIVYFIEASDRFGEEKDFAKELLGNNETLEIEFVKVPGIGTNADYANIDVKGKIALVARGETTFEEKASTAERNGAAAVIIYNNVSGDIKMNVGEVKIPVASISQDDGEFFVALGTGTIKLSKAQAAGPFMSDFSGWGPGPGLEIKPEITGHGGNITSAVPGEDYDTISGTSMATPNIAGVAALLRDYVKRELPDLVKDENGQESLKKVTEVVNRLMMSSADIVLNQNGLPYSVRKQGAGLASILKCSTTGAYILTYDKDNGSVMDRTKIELGDDPAKTGVYTLKFSIENFTDKMEHSPAKSLSYNISAFVMTEGVSETKTGHGDTTVTQESYILDGASLSVKNVSGGTLNGMNITVAPGKTATLEVVITLSDADKKYLDDSFKNGMYVEGFIVLDGAEESTVDLSVPYLAFYGDWTQAPLFDLTYYDTHKDEIDKGLDPEDKAMADAYATRPIGGLYSEFLSYLGAYYYTQDPATKQIAADADKVSISNQEDAVNQLRSVWAGLLRNAKSVDVVITEASTGKVVYTRTEEEIRKSHGGGGTIRPATIDIEFSAIDNNLKNNTKYIVTLKGHLDYEDGGDETNLKNTFTFPLYTDFEAPTLTNCEFYTEYDKSAKKNKLFVKMAIYDNHYSMATHLGYVKSSDLDDDGVDDEYEFVNLEKYMNPVYSNFNSVSYVTYELTDYIEQIKKNSSNPNAITMMCYDYALNQSTYEISLPDDYTDVYFAEFADKDKDGVEEATAITEISLSPNEIYSLRLATRPGTEWAELLTFTADDTDVISIVGNEIVVLGDAAGKTTTIRISDANGKNDYSATLTVKVLQPGEKGYKKIDPKPAKNFKLTGYYVNYAHYFMNSDDRDIGITGTTTKFNGDTYTLEMFPSEQITLQHVLDSYYADRTEIKYVSNNTDFVRVNDKGVVTAIAEGITTLTVNVLLDGKQTTLTKTINISVKDPYVTLGSQIQNYYGLGGVVDISTAGLAVKEIGQYAFANYDYIPKNEEELKLINEEDPYTTKIWYLGDNRLEDKTVEFDDGDLRNVGKITKVIIPEGIEKIGQYAFAGLTELETVVFPSTLKTIEVGAFYNCTKLKTIEFADEESNNVKFLNQKCFQNTNLQNFCGVGVINLRSAIAIGDYAFSIEDEILEWNDNPNYGKGEFEKVNVTLSPKRTITFSEKAQSIGAYAFAGNKSLSSVTISAEKIKLGEYAFKDCTGLKSMTLNASVIPTGAFYNCTKLDSFTIGKDVAVISANAFYGVGIGKFTVADGNNSFKAKANGKYLVDSTETKLVYVTSKYGFEFEDSNIEEICPGAFAGNTNVETIKLVNAKAIGDYAFAGNVNIKKITLTSVTSIGEYAFDGCSKLGSAEFGKSLEYIGSYAFRGTSLTSFKFENYTNLKTIGDYAFESAFTTNTQVAIRLNIPTGVEIGKYAFVDCTGIVEVTLGDNVKVGEGAFTHTMMVPKDIDDLDRTENGQTWEAWYPVSPSNITTLTVGKNVEFGLGAFAGSVSLTKVTLGEGAIIGDSAFLNAENLKEINLKNAVKIGSSAFSTNPYSVFITISTQYPNNINIQDETNTVRLINEAKTQYEVKYMAAPLTTINLSSVTYIGDAAFAFNNVLTTVMLGDAITTLPYGVFAQCTSLRSINLERVSVIGDYAFTGCTELKSVTLNKNGVDEIGEGAFYLCENLVEVANLNKVKVFGAFAFANTDILVIDLTDATAIGKHAFMKDKATNVTLILGSGITSIGDNPFAYCIIDAISTEVEEEFNGKVYTNTVYTFDLSEAVKIIDGSIYAKLPNGKLEFITYCGNGGAVKVAENTSRVSDYSFAGTEVTNVILPYELLSVGHKAFFECKKLSVVTFLGFNAPILEEEYDASYYGSLENLSMSGSLDLYGDGTYVFDGLSIVPYYMWSATSPTNVYYGANFVNYIGHLNDKVNGTDNRIVMVRPSNGNYYDTFIFNQYFKTIVDGAPAADEVTLNAINLINKLPAPNVISLSDKAQVEEARAAYNLIMTTGQQALVETILPLLKEAEKRIETLEYLQNQNNQPTNPDDSEDTSDTEDDVQEDKGPGTFVVILIIIGAAVLAGGIGVGVYFLILAPKAKKNEGSEPVAEEKATEDAASEKSDSTEATESTEPVAENETSNDAASKETVKGENEENPSSEENNK